MGTENTTTLVRPPYPTDTEVAALVAEYQDAEPGTVATHKAIEALTGTKRGTARYQTIVDRWKVRMADEHNIRLGSVRGEGYRVLDGAGRIASAVAYQTQGVKRVARGATIAATTDARTLTPEERRAREHALLLNGALQAAINTTALAAAGNGNGPKGITEKAQ